MAESWGRETWGHETWRRDVALALNAILADRAAAVRATVAAAARVAPATSRRDLDCFVDAWAALGPAPRSRTISRVPHEGEWPEYAAELTLGVELDRVFLLGLARSIDEGIEELVRRQVQAEPATLPGLVRDAAGTAALPRALARAILRATDLLAGCPEVAAEVGGAGALAAFADVFDAAVLRHATARFQATAAGQTAAKAEVITEP